MLTRIVRHPLYVFLVMFVVMPINGGFIESGDYITGAILASMHIPWFIYSVLPVLKVYQIAEERGHDFESLTR